jgi:hypothetical protein
MNSVMPNWYVDRSTRFGRRIQQDARHNQSKGDLKTPKFETVRAGSIESMR